MRNHQTRQLVLASIAPALLVLVATIQHIAVFRYQLAPQRGGGFGMFSAIDSSRNRYLKAFLISGEQTYALEYPSALYDHALLAEALPTQARLEQFAHRLVRRQWFAASEADSGGLVWASSTPSGPNQNQLVASKIRLEFWQTDMDHQGNLTLKLSKATEVETK